MKAVTLHQKGARVTLFLIAIAVIYLVFGMINASDTSARDAYISYLLIVIASCVFIILAIKLKIVKPVG